MFDERGFLRELWFRGREVQKSVSFHLCLKIENQSSHATIRACQKSWESQRWGRSMGRERTDTCRRTCYLKHPCRLPSASNWHAAMRPTLMVVHVPLLVAPPGPRQMPIKRMPPFPQLLLTMAQARNHQAPTRSRSPRAPAHRPSRRNVLAPASAMPPTSMCHL